MRMMTVFSLIAMGTLALAAPSKLYKNERYKFGSERLEQQEFQKHAEIVGEFQKEFQKQHPSGTAGRVFHRKDHGCLTGKLVLRGDRPEWTRHGIFSTGARNTLNVLAHFTNGVGTEEHDLKPDVRGLAIKIFGTSDANNPGLRTVDFLMTNAPNPFGKDQAEFVKFGMAMIRPGDLYENFVEFALEHPEIVEQVMERTLKVVPSLAQETYWSGHPYLLGSDAAMKLNLRPAKRDTEEDLDQEVDEHLRKLAEETDQAEDLLDLVGIWAKRIRATIAGEVGRNYLRTDLLKRAKKGTVKFVLSLQGEVDARRTPIENAFIEWREEDSRSTPVADLMLDAQDFSVPGQADLCRDIAFTPGHYHSEHRPLGNMARGRIFTYRASSEGRAAKADPAEEPLFTELRQTSAVR